MELPRPNSTLDPPNMCVGAIPKDRFKSMLAKPPPATDFGRVRTLSKSLNTADIYSCCPEDRCARQSRLYLKNSEWSAAGATNVALVCMS